jgi:hypothetical protein
MCSRCKIRAFNFMDPPGVVANRHGHADIMFSWIKKNIHFLFLFATTNVTVALNTYRRREYLFQPILKSTWSVPGHILTVTPAVVEKCFSSHKMGYSQICMIFSAPQPNVLFSTVYILTADSLQ